MPPSLPLDPIESPVFMVGAVRSGTTLLRHMLDSHPDIAFIYESQFLVDRIAPNGAFPPLDEYWEYLEQERSFLGTGFTIDRSLDFVELSRSFLEQRRRRDGKAAVGATVHRYFDRLLHSWPTARFLHIIRDGRDVSRSRIGFGWAGNGWVSIERWLEVEHLWERMKELVPSERRLEVRYEDLIREPERVLTEICHFFGLEFSERMFDYAKTSTYDLPDPKLVNQWKNKSTEDEVRLVEARAGSMLETRGYELSGFPRLEVGAIRRRLLLLHNKWFVTRFAMKRFGLGLFLSGWVARKLKIKPLARSVKLKTDAIRNQHLK